MVAGEADAQIEDVQLTGLNGSIAWRATPRARLKVLAKIRERLAQRPHGYGVQFRVNLQLVDSRPDEFAGPFVHRSIGFIGPTQHPQLVRILAWPQLEDGW